MSGLEPINKILEERYFGILKKYKKGTLTLAEANAAIRELWAERKSWQRQKRKS